MRAGRTAPRFILSKNLAAASDDRAAGELEGARPASSTIARRSKSLAEQGFSKTAFCVRPKCSAGKRSQRSPPRDFFDKLGRGAQRPAYSICRSRRAYAERSRCPLHGGKRAHMARSRCRLLPAIRTCLFSYLSCGQVLSGQASPPESAS